MSKLRIPFLTSGVQSGLGRFLHERLGGEGLTRETPASSWGSWAEGGAEVILHCAASPARGREPSALYEDNLRLTERLSALPHRLFVYLSTVDVYPKAGGPHREEEPIDPDGVCGLYAATKLLAEAVVRRSAAAHLILRPGALLGPTMRPNAALRLIQGEPALGLSGESAFNFVLYDDVLAFLRVALREGVRGTFNAVSSASITLAEAAALLGRRVSFGDALYRSPRADNAKIRAHCPAFGRSSGEVLREFAQSRLPAP